MINTEKFIAGLHDYIGKALAPIVARLKALEERPLDSLADVYRGSWQPNNVYARGSLITFQGALWLAMDNADGKPGASPSLRLIVKAGRDAT